MNSPTMRLYRRFENMNHTWKFTVHYSGSRRKTCVICYWFAATKIFYCKFAKLNYHTAGSPGKLTKRSTRWSGSTRAKRAAISYLYWPCIDNDAKNMAQQCFHRTNQPRNQQKYLPKDGYSHTTTILIFLNGGMFLLLSTHIPDGLKRTLQLQPTHPYIATHVHRCW